METKSVVKMKVFTFKDFLRFALIAIFANIIFIYFLLNSVTKIQNVVMTIVTGLCFWLPYVSVLKTRRDWIKSVAFVTKHGLPVITNEFDVKQADVEAVTDETIEAWDIVLNKNAADVIDTLFIEFKPYPVHHWRDPSKALAGMLIGKKAVIGHKPDIHATALSHELGHEIHYNYIGYYDADSCHEFMKKNRLR